MQTRDKGDLGRDTSDGCTVMSNDLASKGREETEKGGEELEYIYVYWE